MDRRYRTYEQLTKQQLPYRIHEGRGKSDFITVGKLTNCKGVYSDKSFIEVYNDFHSRKEGIELVDNKFVISGKNTKSAILKKNLELRISELPKIKARWEEFHPGRTPKIEIGNEPNIFPYMSPLLYAWYYKKWHDKVTEIMPDAVFMNGGLWILYGLPNVILKNLNLIKVTNYSAKKYYKEVFTILRTFDEKYIPQILNLHFYPYIGRYSKHNIAQHADWLKNTILSLNDFYKKAVWLTEFGNINPLNSEDTRNFVKSMMNELETTGIRRWYYFRVAGTDSKFDIIKDNKSKYTLIKTLMFFANIPLIKIIVNSILKISKMPSVSDLNKLLAIFKDYSNRLPKQSLEKNSELNIVGEFYLKRANK